MKIRLSIIWEILLFSLASCGFILGLYGFNLTANKSELSLIFMILFLFIYISVLIINIIITQNMIEVIDQRNKQTKLDGNLTMGESILFLIFIFITNLMIIVLHINDLFWSIALAFSLYQFTVVILVVVILIMNKKLLHKTIKLN